MKSLLVRYINWLWNTTCVLRIWVRKSTTKKALQHSTKSWKKFCELYAYSKSNFIHFWNQRKNIESKSWKRKRWKCQTQKKIQADVG